MRNFMQANGWCSVLWLLLSVIDATGAEQPAPKAVTFDDVLWLVAQGRDAATILEQCDTVFTFDIVQRGRLVKAGATPALLDALEKRRMLQSDVVNYAVILDCSGSMKDKTPDGESKMTAAKRVVAELIQKIPDGKQVCFLIYGHDAALKCEAVKVVRPLKELDASAKASLTKFIADLEPVGHTPIALSLRMASDALAQAKGLTQVVLITDGMESCHGDPAREAEKLAQARNVRSVDVIGLGLDDKEKVAVTLIARRGRGKFYDAQNAADLTRGLQQVVAVKDPAPVAKDAPADPPVDVKTTAVIKALIDGLSDMDSFVRHAAAVSLGKMGAKAKAAVPALMKRIADDLWSGVFSADVAAGNTSKDAALKALRQIAPDKVESALLAATKSKNTTVRKWAIEQLGAEK
jgi:Mg-chelatase subunit ChlD